VATAPKRGLTTSPFRIPRRCHKT